MLEELISQYNSALDVLNKEGKEYTSIKLEELPAARAAHYTHQNLANGVVSQQKCCLDAAKMATLNDKLIQFEKEAKGSLQITENLEKRLTAIKANLQPKRQELQLLRRKIFQAKSDDLLKNMPIKDEMVEILEKVLAARHLAGGAAGYYLADPLRSALGAVAQERMNDVQRQLTAELDIKNAEPFNL